MAGRVLMIIFLLGQVIDILSTHVAINFFQKAESNPVANSLFMSIGMEEVFAIKLVIAAVLVMLYELSIQKWGKIRWSMEKSLQLGGVQTWFAAFLNIAGMLRII
jgi:uncharacterized membrane protein